MPDLVDSDIGVWDDLQPSKVIDGGFDCVFGAFEISIPLSQFEPLFYLFNLQAVPLGNQRHRIGILHQSGSLLVDNPESGLNNVRLLLQKRFIDRDHKGWP